MKVVLNQNLQVVYYSHTSLIPHPCTDEKLVGILKQIDQW